MDHTVRLQVPGVNVIVAILAGATIGSPVLDLQNASVPAQITALQVHQEVLVSRVRVAAEQVELAGLEVPVAVLRYMTFVTKIPSKINECSRLTTLKVCRIL